MKIIQKQKQLVNVSSIKTGEVFSLSGLFYIKCDMVNSDGRITCVSLDAGCLFYFFPDMKVENVEYNFFIEKVGGQE